MAKALRRQGAGLVSQSSLFGVLVAIVLSLPSVGLAARVDEPSSQQLMRLTRHAHWTQVAAIKIPFRTYHPQGMVKIGDTFFVSSVELPRRPARNSPDLEGQGAGAAEGVGHLFKIAADGHLIADLKLGEGAIYHPGGIDFDGRSIWVPVSEYRPHSHAIVYRVDPSTMTSKEAFRFSDHLGAVAYDRQSRQLYAVNWGSRQIYAWPRGFPGTTALRSLPPAPSRWSNPDQYIDYQDCHALPGRQMLCAGLADYPAADGTRFSIGGIDLIDLKRKEPIWQAPLELRSPTGRLMTQNPFFMQATASGLRAYFMPDDDDSTIFVFDVAP